MAVASPWRRAHHLRWLVYAALALVVVDASSVTRVVFLMMENRSFDHMLGFLKSRNKDINGLTGTESVPLNAKDPHSKRRTVEHNPSYIGNIDPVHKINATTYKIFGGYEPKDPAPMSGFLDWELNSRKPLTGLSNASEVVNCFEPDRVPVLATLAQEFALFDEYFASLPGPTYPNRMFSVTGTSYGAVDNNPPDAGWPQATIFEQLEEVGKTWAIYYHDYCIALSLKQLRTKERLERVLDIENFFGSARNGTLPNFSFLEPRYSPDALHPKKVDEAANDQHPDNDVALGEKLIKDVYEALRQGPLWNETLLVVTYDEHGGYWDHVPPPQQGVPNPDGLAPDQPVLSFNFTRLGVRVPFVLASPWIPKGHVEHGPSSAHAPFASSRYEHSSLLATLRRLFGTKSFLTKRDAWAAPFDHVLSEPAPRTDCPWSLPSVPLPEPEALAADLSKAMNDLQCDILMQFGGKHCKHNKFHASKETKALFAAFRASHSHSVAKP